MRREIILGFGLVLLVLSFMGILIANAPKKAQAVEGTVLCQGSAGQARPRLKVLDAVSLERTGKANYKIVVKSGDYMFIDMDTGTCLFTTEPAVRAAPIIPPLEKGPSI